MGDIQQDAASIEQFQAIWQKALDDYKERTDRDLINDKEIQEWNIRTADNFTEIVSERDRHFNDSRKKYQKARDNLKACIQPVEQLSAIATSALSFTPFAPAATIFGAGMFLIRACENVSNAYACVTQLFEECQEFTQRLKLYSTTEMNSFFLEKVTAILSFLIEVFGRCEKIVSSSRTRLYLEGLLKGKNELLNSAVAKLNKHFEHEQQFNIAQIYVEGTKARSEISRLADQQEQERNRQKQAELRASIETLSLGPIDIVTRQAEECRKSSNSPPTWIFDDGLFQDWLQDTSADHSWLWGLGNAGAGKTSLVSFLAKSWQNQDALSESATRSKHYVNGGPGEVQLSLQKPAVALFYCSYRFKDEQRPDGVFQSLIRQLLEQLQVLDWKRAEKRIKQLHSGRTSTAFNWTNMLDNVISEFQQTFIIIDALDENEAGYGELTLRLSRLKSASLKLFVTSRDELSMRAEALNRRALQLTIRARADFIESYVQARLTRIEARDETAEYIGSSALPDILRDPPQRKQKVIKKIVEASDGNFYYAELQITTLKAEITTDDIESRLGDLATRSLGSLIGDIIERISRQTDRDRREMGMKALMWATYAGRTLTIDEIRHAVALAIRSQAQDDPKTQRMEVERLTQHILVESSRYFLRVDDKTEEVQVHKSIKDYCDVSNIFEDAHYQMAAICLTFLDRRFFSLRCSSKAEYEALKRENPFYEYAARNWGFHMRRAGEGKFLGPASPISMVTMLNRRLFLNSVAAALHEDLQNLRMWNWNNHDTWKGLQDRDRPVLWPIHLLTYFDLQHTADWWLRQNRGEVDRPSQTGTTPLYLACSLGRVRIVETLLFDYDAKPTLKGAEQSGFNLAAAVFVQSAGIVERLLFVNPTELVQQTNWHGRFPLGEAAMRADEDIVRMITKAISGLPNSEALLLYQERNNAWNALHEAAGALHPSPKIMEILLKAKGGRKLLQQGTKSWGDTPLHTAAVRGKATAVKALLDLDADPMIKQKQGKSPLHIAVEHLNVKNPEVISILLNSGKFDPLSQDNDGFTTWHLAAAQGRLENLRLLVEKGPKMLFNVRNRNKMIPIRTAANHRRNDWLGCVDVLLELCPGQITTEDAYPILDVLIHEQSEVGIRALRRLLENRVNPWPLHRGKTTVLHRVIDHSSLEGVKITWELFGSKEVLEYHDAYESTALGLASLRRSFETARFLIDLGADVNAQDKTGRTPLHYAIERDMPDLAAALLDKHADYHIKDKNGITALERASAQNACRQIWQVRAAKFTSSTRVQRKCVSTKKTKRHHVVGNDETRNQQLGQGISADALDVKRAQYLRSDPIPVDAKLPILRVEVSVNWRTVGVSELDDAWFDLDIMKNERIDQQLFLCSAHKPLQDGNDQRSVTATWHLDKGHEEAPVRDAKNGTNEQVKAFVRRLGIGDRVVMVATAAGLGKVNIVEEAEVIIFFED